MTGESAEVSDLRGTCATRLDDPQLASVPVHKIKSQNANLCESLPEKRHCLSHLKIEPTMWAAGCGC